VPAAKSHSDNSAAQFSCECPARLRRPRRDRQVLRGQALVGVHPDGHYRYYDGTLYMLELLHVSGTFKLWI
jgi:hypothetical protein